MATPAHQAFSPAATPTGTAARLPSGWGDRVRRLVLDVRQLTRDHVELAVLEAQRATQVFARTVAAAVAISVLAATAWLGFIVAVVVWITDAGLSLPAALLIGAAACLVVAGGIAWWVKSQLPELMFSATLRQLRATRNADDDELDAEPPSQPSSELPGARP